MRIASMNVLSVLSIVIGFPGYVLALTAEFRGAGPPLVETKRPSAADVIGELDASKLRMRTSPESPEIAATLSSAETFQSNWLQDRRGGLQGVGTIRHGLEDVLLARWAGDADQRQIRNVEMWDGALYELVIFEVDRLVIESAESVRKRLLL